MKENNYEGKIGRVLFRQEREQIEQWDKANRELKTRISNSLLVAHGQWVEQGQPEHIITLNEAEQILGVKSRNELGNLFRKTYQTNSLNEVLEILSLPHKKINRTF